ncbi:serine hydrolase domain-containing protein [Thermodesulfobacteriota bacterium]
MKKRIPTRIPAKSILAAALLLLTAACSPDIMTPPDPTPQDSYRIDTLPGSDNATTRLNQRKLQALVRKINRGLLGNMHSLVIIHNDELVLEEYFAGWTRDMLHPCYSATKSITSALVGMAIEQEHITGVDANMLDFFPEYGSIANPDQRKEAITLEHLLTMSAGFEWDEVSAAYVDQQGNINAENSAMQMAQSDDWIKFVLDLPLISDPGSEFLYNSGVTQLLSGILTSTTGLTAEAYAAENLFPHLGITEWRWPADPLGHSNTGYGLSLHPANMAMFGYLFLKGGRLGGVQVVPESWVADSVAHHIAFANWDEYMNENYEYGYQWWLIPDHHTYADPENIGDIYYASGFGGQKIVVMPDIDMVVVTTSADFPAGMGSFLALFEGILPALEHLD